MARRLTILVTVLLVSLSLGASLAFGWCNGPAAGGKAGYGYGTHDWILDHAIQQAGVEGEWVELDTALWHTNDPDFLHTNSDFHLFRDSGRSRGGPQEISNLYYSGSEALKTGDAHTASVRLGVLAHYYGDIVQPFHTSYDALKYDTRHSQYEHEVDESHRNYSSADRTGWLSPAAAKPVTDVRARAISAAKYSRSKYKTLLGAYHPGNVRSNSTVNAITGAVLNRAVNDLADLIRTMPTGTGASLPPAKVSASINKQYPGRGRKICGYAKCTDADGNPVEGARVDFYWPKTGGGTTKVGAYTDINGRAYNWYTVPSGLTLMKRYELKTSASSAGTSTADTTWFKVTPPLASGSSGIKTSSSSSAPRRNSVVRVKTVVRDTKGRPVVGLPVTFIWSHKGYTVKYRTVTNSSGVARHSRNIGSCAKGYRVAVRAQVVSNSTRRSSTARFTPR